MLLTMPAARSAVLQTLPCPREGPPLTRSLLLPLCVHVGRSQGHAEVVQVALSDEEQSAQQEFK